jgi:hypothetical protein
MLGVTFDENYSGDFMKFNLIVGACALAAATAAQAAPITFQFTGTLDSSDVVGYEVGSLVSGEFTYETDTLPTSEPEPVSDGFQLVVYGGLSAPASFKFNIGGDAMSFSNVNVVILDNDGLELGSEFLSISGEGATVNGAAGTSGVSLTLGTVGTNPDVLSVALPSTLNLSDFQGALAMPSGTFISDSSGTQMATFTVTSLTAAPAVAVPEPATALSMLLGLGLMGGVMRRRRAS